MLEMPETSLQRRYGLTFSPTMTSSFSNGISPVFCSRGVPDIIKGFLRDIPKRFTRKNAWENIPRRIEKERMNTRVAMEKSSLISLIRYHLGKEKKVGIQ
jgi:hypothetical protein